MITAALILTGAAMVVGSSIAALFCKDGTRAADTFGVGMVGAFCLWLAAAVTGMAHL